MGKLATLLKYGYAGNAERHRMLKKESFKKTIGEEAYKTLLQSEANAIENTTLVQEEVAKTIIEGAEPFKVMREVVPVIKTKSYSVRFVKGSAGTYAEDIAEGAAIQVDTQSYSKQDITIKKIGTRPLITNELIEDELFDVVELELKKAGARLENKLNRDVLNAMLNGSNKITTNTVDPGAGNHIDVADIASAVGKVKKHNYLPDILLTHPTAEAYLFADSNIAYAAYAGTNEPLTTGRLPKLLGLTPYTLTVTDKSSPTWDDTTGGTDVTAIVFSKNDLAVIAMRRDVTIEQYEDPIHDLVGISCTMRYGTDVLREEAGCIIYHR